jgi:alanine racemase
MTARVDLGAIRSNFAALRSLTGDRTVMACIKGNAYGHGLVPVARCLEDAGVPWLTLGSLDEPLALPRAGIATPVLPFPTIAGLDLEPLRRRVDHDWRAVGGRSGGARPWRPWR